MAGKRHKKEILNATLAFITKLLHENKIKNWFIAYGTLLGIVRENSCIEGDDDIDIVLDINNYHTVKKMLQDNNLPIMIDKPNMLKTDDTDEYCSIDFYLSFINGKGNFIDSWERVVWTSCYVDDTSNLIEYEWNETKLFLPNKYEQKLQNRYGDWRTPRDDKGGFPRKLCL